MCVCLYVCVFVCCPKQMISVFSCTFDVFHASQNSRSHRSEGCCDLCPLSAAAVYRWRGWVIALWFVMITKTQQLIVSLGIVWCDAV